MHLVDGDLDGAEEHRRFYDEYNAVLDMPGEYYLDCIRIVFHEHQLPRGLWTVYVLVPAQGGEDGIARVERRAVQILHDEAGRVFVDGTLEDGERVLAVGVDRVVPGQRVAPRPEPVPDDGVRVSDGTS